MLHKSDSTNPENGNTRTGVSSPVSVQVHLNSFVEHTVTTLDSVSLNTGTEITRTLGVHLQMVDGRTPIRFVEFKELFVRTSSSHLIN